MGETNLQSDLEKLYKPLIDSQDGKKENISKLQDQADKFTLTFSNSYPEANREIMITDSKKLLPFHEENKGMRLGKIATDYLRMYANSKKSTDTTFGIHSKDDIFYIGKKPIHINDEDITIDDETYYGTPGLWELIVKFNPEKNLYTEDDLKKYRNILIRTDGIPSDANPYKPKSSRSGKYREIVAPIWRDINKKRKSKGNGIGGRTVIQTIILPSDPDELIEKLELRIAALKAGNTGAGNEADAICDELLRQGVMNSEHVKCNKSIISYVEEDAVNDLGKTAITAAKSAGKELSTSAIEAA
ncbi:uncharacterized protein LOC136081457 [Hydra vulgaris]|uniref:Uncharacterized protein LOC136081457 n=1 Tax=Hydra vulgaris TaxID=6087 RepID=A0ABM4BZZ5_HYDVU